MSDVWALIRRYVFGKEKPVRVLYGGLVPGPATPPGPPPPAPPLPLRPPWVATDAESIVRGFRLLFEELCAVRDDLLAACPPGGPYTDYTSGEVAGERDCLVSVCARMAEVFTNPTKDTSLTRLLDEMRKPGIYPERCGAKAPGVWYYPEAHPKCLLMAGHTGQHESFHHSWQNPEAKAIRCGAGWKHAGHVVCKLPPGHAGYHMNEYHSWGDHECSKR